MNNLNPHPWRIEPRGGSITADALSAEDLDKITLTVQGMRFNQQLVIAELENTPGGVRILGNQRQNYLRNHPDLPFGLSVTIRPNGTTVKLIAYKKEETKP